jgi:GTP-binding protein
VIRVTDARFVAGVGEPGSYPDRAHPAVGRAPEIAFAGRSNVGKSSLINSLLRRRKLAHTSSTPGRTRQLNFYAVKTAGGAVVFVDLPGYGYARVAKSERALWSPLVERYLEGRSRLRGVVLVVDIRRGVEAEERQLLEYLRFHARPAVVAATKVDLLVRRRRPAALRAIADAVDGAEVVCVSGNTREGCEEIWRRLLAPPICIFGQGTDCPGGPAPSTRRGLSFSRTST